MIDPYASIKELAQVVAWLEKRLEKWTQDLETGDYMDKVVAKHNLQEYRKVTLKELIEYGYQNWEVVK